MAIRDWVTLLCLCFSDGWEQQVRSIYYPELFIGRCCFLQAQSDV